MPINPNIIHIPELTPERISDLGAKALGVFLDTPIEELTPDILIGAASLGATEIEVAGKFSIDRKDNSRNEG